jgi:replication factor A1
MHDCEITFNSSTRIVEIDDPGAAAISGTHAFTPICEIPTLSPNREVDILAWVVSADAITDVQIKKDSSVAQVRRVELCDTSNHRCQLTLWRGAAVNFPDGANCVVSIKFARVSNFNGRSLQASPSSIVSIDPDIPEAAALRQWAASGIDFASLPTISLGADSGALRAYLAQINERRLGSRDKPDYIVSYVLCADVPVGHRMYYLACPTPACKFKGLSARIPGENTYVCERCHQTITTPFLKYTFSVKVADFSGSVPVGVLGEDSLGALFTGVGVDEWVSTTNDGQDQQTAMNLVRQRYFQPLQIKIRVKSEVYNEVTRVKVSLMSATKVPFAEGAKFYASEIMKFASRS